MQRSRLGESWFSAGCHTWQGTWIGLVIRLDVDLALGQHLRKFSLQLLILLVVGDCINRSTESSLETREVNREKNSQKKSGNTAGILEPTGNVGRKNVKSQVGRNRKKARGKGTAGCSAWNQLWAGHLTAAQRNVTQTEQWGDTGKVQLQNVKATFTRKKRLRFLLMLRHASWLKPCTLQMEIKTEKLLGHDAVDSLWPCCEEGSPNIQLALLLYHLKKRLLICFLISAQERRAADICAPLGSSALPTVQQSSMCSLK